MIVAILKLEKYKREVSHSRTVEELEESSEYSELVQTLKGEIY